MSVRTGVNKMGEEWIEYTLNLYLCPICGIIPCRSNYPCYECMEKEQERKPDWIEEIVGKKWDIEK